MTHTYTILLQIASTNMQKKIIVWLNSVTHTVKWLYSWNDNFLEDWWCKRPHTEDASQCKLCDSNSNNIIIWHFEQIHMNINNSVCLAAMAAYLIFLFVLISTKCVYDLRRSFRLTMIYLLLLVYALLF